MRCIDCQKYIKNDQSIHSKVYTVFAFHTCWTSFTFLKNMFANILKLWLQNTEQLNAAKVRKRAIRLRTQRCLRKHLIHRHQRLFEVSGWSFRQQVYLGSLPIQTYTLPETTCNSKSTWKWMLGRWISFWEGLFSMAKLLVLGRVFKRSWDSSKRHRQSTKLWAKAWGKGQKWRPFFQIYSGWWFQPIWKILVKMGIFPK